MGHYATEEQLVSLVSDMASKINIASGTQGVSGSYVPIGFIEAFMGTTAPPDFLACDGSLHQISQYPDLADHFYEQFGASNYFGGDGIAKFAVPDLRGEFLRGTGTNSHTDQGSGGTVGEHQDGTKHMGFFSDTNLVFPTNSTVQHEDFIIKKYGRAYPTNCTQQNQEFRQYYTSRPTNTSVLWCIKAIDVKTNNYSTDASIVGKWINGGIIYGKLIELSSAVSLSSSGTVIADLPTDAKFVRGTAFNTSGDVAEVDITASTKTVYCDRSMSANSIYVEYML